MEWQRFGFKDDPLKTTPIMDSNLELFTGRNEEITVCKNILANSNARIVIEGARGIGTTSFANYLRFCGEVASNHFTPKIEIKVEQGWKFETLLAAIISNLVRQMGLLGKKSILSDKRFQDAKAVSMNISETYRLFGIEALGFGATYGKQTGISSQPIIVPSTTLGHYLEDLIAIIRKHGYKNGVLFQLNNLDIGEIHSPEEMRYLFNSLRDYTQIDGSSWLFVGDLGLRKFIAQHVDRMDDIISYEVTLNPLPIKDFLKMIDKRVNYYAESKKVVLPIEKPVFEYLYKITHGRIRYIFGLITRLMARLYVGDLTNMVTLDIACPMLMKLGQDRVQRANITAMEEKILRILTQFPGSTPSSLSTKINKTSQYTGRVLQQLLDKKIGFVSETWPGHNVYSIY